MPQIKIRGIQLEKVCSISKEIVDTLEQIIKCPREYFTIEHISTTFIKDGTVDDGYPFVEIVWFDRSKDIQDSVAKAVTHQIQKIGYKNVDIFFTVLKENSYYENGEHF